MQVENECGLMGVARDHVDAADAAFEAIVPRELLVAMRGWRDGLSPDIATAFAEGAGTGSWKDVFGPDSEEIFHLWHTARYVETVASASKAAHPLPLFVNAWLDEGHESGRFPTGGPKARVFEVWRTAASSIDVLGADIYPRAFCDVRDSYRKPSRSITDVETSLTCVTHGVK